MLRLMRRHHLTGLLSRANIPSVAINNFPSNHQLSGVLSRSNFHTQTIHWKNDGESESYHYQLLSFRPLAPTPLQAITADDTTRSVAALQHLRKGQALIYFGGDYHNARQLLQAMKRKCTGTSGIKNQTKKRKRPSQHVAVEPNVQWIQQKQWQREQSDILQKLLIQISIENGRPSKIVGLKRAPPNVKEILSYAFQTDLEKMDACLGDQPFFLLSLVDFLGIVGGYEWNRKGVYIDALHDYIYPHFGVFPPTRQDYITLLDKIDVGKTQQKPISMMEVGIGTGVLSIILLQQKKVDRVIGTDANPYAVACAKDNIQRFGFHDQVDLIEADLFPTKSDSDTDNKVDIVIFNPPWIPGDAATWLDKSVYDPDQSLLRRFLLQVQNYVNDDGHVYLLLSNLGILLGLFSEEDLYSMFHEGNLELVEVHSTKPKAMGAKRGQRKKMEKKPQHDLDDIAKARAQEVISLYKLRIRK